MTKYTDAVCEARGHDWVDEFEHEGKLHWTCDRCGEETVDE